MKKAIVILAFLLLAGFSGGCAVIPAIVTTGASFAVPQTASLAITAAGTVHKTALIAADERDVDDMLTDKMLTIQAQAILLAETGADMEATCLNGDIYVVGEYVTPADRDSAIEVLESIQGVHSVKGVLKPMPESLVELVKPTIADHHAETVIEAGLIKELHIKSANVDVEVVQGEAVIMGVVRDQAEADAVVRLVESLRPRSATPITVTSLLVLQEEYEAGRIQPNAAYALHPRTAMLAQALPQAQPQVEPAAIPVSTTLVEPEGEPVLMVAAVAVDTPSMDTLAAYIPQEKTLWQKSRLRMKRRIAGLARMEKDADAKKELITLSTRVLKDKHISIEDRLARTLLSTTNLTVKRHVGSILSEFAPQRASAIRTMAMN